MAQNRKAAGQQLATVSGHPLATSHPRAVTVRSNFGRPQHRRRPISPRRDSTTHCPFTSCEFRTWLLRESASLTISQDSSVRHGWHGHCNGAGISPTTTPAQAGGRAQHERCLAMLNEFLMSVLHNLFKPLLLFFYAGLLIPTFKVNLEFPKAVF